MNNIYFKSEGHKQRLLTAMQSIGKIYGGKLDPEYAAALYILTADAGTWESTQTFVYGDGINIEGMLGGLSSGETIMLQLAGNLFNGNQHIDPLEFVRLDERNFLVALSAIVVRRVGMRLEDFEEK